MEFDGKWIRAASYDVLWELAGGGLSKPAVLRGDSPGDTEAERRRLVADAVAELRDAGYVGPHGPHEEVRTLLDTVGDPRLAVDVRVFEWVPDADPARLVRRGVRVAVRGSRAAVTELVPGRFRAWTFPPTSLANEVGRLFPHHDGPRRMVFGGASIPADHVTTGLGRRDLPARVSSALAGGFLRRAHLCVIADHTGGRRVSPGLTLNDTVDAGRFLVFPDRGQLAVVPGNKGALERKVRELIDHVR
jgi:EspG family